MYYDQTDRNPGTQILQYLKSINKGEETTPFVTHCIDFNHTFSMDKIKRFHTAKKSLWLNALEHLEIRRDLRKGEHIAND